MTTNSFLRCLLMLELLLPAINCPALHSGDITREYRGFVVDYSEVLKEKDFETLRAAMNRQIDMVVAVGVPPGMLAFFKTVPIRVRKGTESFAGHYTNLSEAVELTSAFLSNGRKATLLHEFLHAYHHQRMEGGFRNRTVVMYYQRAKAINAYDSKSHMMADAKEYFASAATAYLFGVAPLEPFQREKVQRGQPEFYEFLRSLFGPDAGHYQGSLER